MKKIFLLFLISVTNCVYASNSNAEQEERQDALRNLGLTPEEVLSYNFLNATLESLAVTLHRNIEGTNPSNEHVRSVANQTALRIIEMSRTPPANHAPAQNGESAGMGID